MNGITKGKECRLCMFTAYTDQGKLILEFGDLLPFLVKVAKSDAEVMGHIGGKEEKQILLAAFFTGFLFRRRVALKRRYGFAYPLSDFVDLLVELPFGQVGFFTHCRHSSAPL